MYALIDCNNFYASCERVFQPRLKTQPIVILSNNDGCIIARSNEAKALGIPMGAPYFEWKQVCKKNQVVVFSSNYELYGDMSARVMLALQQLCPDMEVYSIDEAFLNFASFAKKDWYTFALKIKHTVDQWTGIPLSVGFAQTKTLAKIANKIAKQQARSGVYDLSAPLRQQRVLKNYPVAEIWGVGRRLALRLGELNIHTAQQLRDSDPKWIRSHFSVVMERMVWELRGVSCLPLEAVQPKKQIMTSRSFGKLVTELEDLEEAMSYYVTLASENLRMQKSLAQGMGIFLETNIFKNNEAQYKNSFFCHFPDSTNDTSYMISVAKKNLRRIYRRGFRYKKAGIILLDLIPDKVVQLSLFNAESVRKKHLMKTIDKINQVMGKSSVFYCAEGIKKDWQIRRQYQSPCYTTRLQELLTVRCD